MVKTAMTDLIPAKRLWTWTFVYINWSLYGLSCLYDEIFFSRLLDSLISGPSA